MKKETNKAFLDKTNGTPKKALTKIEDFTSADISKEDCKQAPKSFNRTN